MSFIRPEAAALMMRWRESVISLGLIALGAWFILGFSGLLPYVGYVLITLGGMMMVIGVQRARFRVPGAGPGIVQITEDQITYFGPLTGGTIALSDLTRLSLDGTGKPVHWVLSQTGQPDLCIPTTASGSETLFDVFARLPGLRTEHMLATLNTTEKGIVLLWQRGDVPDTLLN